MLIRVFGLEKNMGFDLERVRGRLARD